MAPERQYRPVKAVLALKLYKRYYRPACVQHIRAEAHVVVSPLFYPFEGLDYK